MLDFKTVVDWITKLPITGLFILAILSFYRKWVVPQWYVDRIEKELEEWKKLALQGTNIAQMQGQQASAAMDLIAKNVSAINVSLAKRDDTRSKVQDIET